MRRRVGVLALARCSPRLVVLSRRGFDLRDVVKDLFLQDDVGQFGGGRVRRALLTTGDVRAGGGNNVAPLEVDIICPRF